MLLCDSNGNPLCAHLVSGKAHEASTLVELLDAADRQLLVRGRRIDWPRWLIGDKAYRAKWIDEHLIDLGISPVIPTKSNQDASKRQVVFDPVAYRKRNVVERLIGWLKESRRLLSRFEKTATNYLGMITVAFIRRYLRNAYGGL